MPTAPVSQRCHGMGQTLMIRLRTHPTRSLHWGQSLDSTAFLSALKMLLLSESDEKESPLRVLRAAILCHANEDAPIAPLQHVNCK